MVNKLQSGDHSGAARPERTGPDAHDDPRYMEGQRVLVDAMRYLLQSDRDANREAAELLSEHVRTMFRMSDSPFQSGPRP